MLAPIVVFAFNRPNALNNLLTSLKRNHLFEESKLFIFIDGCRNKNDMPQVNEVYAIARKFCNESKENRHIIISQQNRGLGTSIITGVSTIIEKYGKAIVLEDDLTCTPNFLSYINQALDYYEHDKRIFSICGYGLKIKKPIGYSSDVYLSKRSSSWGWATWKDRWEQVDWEIQDWKELVNNKKQQKAFNKNGSDMYSMLKGYMEGKNHSWAIRFCYNQFKLGKYSVCPFLSKINNEGFGENATNCKQTFCRFKTEIDTTNQNIFIFDKNIMPNKLTGNVINTTQFQLEYIVKSGKLYTYKKNTYNIYSINVDYSTFKIFMICTKLRCIYNLTFNILYTNRGHYKLQIKYKIKSFLNHFKKINYEYSNRWNRICGFSIGYLFRRNGHQRNLY